MMIIGDESSLSSRWSMRALKGILTRIDPQSIAVLMIVAMLVGVGTSFTALLFIKIIEWITSFSFDTVLPDLLGFLGEYWIVLVPVLGALISGPIIAFWAIEAKGHGVPEVMQAIAMNEGRIRPRVAVVKSIASAFCIGTGGSAGREGPIVQIGSALGSTVAQLLRLGPERTITLLACGAAAGISATFNAPIAGVIFAMEVILGEFTTHYFGMVVVSSVAASVVSRHYLGENPAFAIPAYNLVSEWELPLYAVLGVLAAVTGWFFVSVLYYAEDRFDGWRFPDALKPVVGAVPVGLIAVFYPQALGTGLSIIEDALKGNLGWVLLLSLIFIKMLSTTFTLGSGNSGGIFSPTLFMGAMLGGAFGYGVNFLFPGITANAGAYALVGMASVFSSAAHAPLTAFLIVFEMSGDYRMILPLMITVGISTLLSQFLRRHSIYTLKLVRRGVPLERGRDVDVMQGITVEEVMTRNPDVVRAEMSLRELARVFTRTHHHGFPVLDGEGHFIGVVTIQDLERATAQGFLPETKVEDIAQHHPVTTYPDETLARALHAMSDQNVGRVPVVERANPSKLIGLVRRENIVRAYRHAILRKLESQHRQESFRLGKLTEMEILEIPLSKGMASIGLRIQELDLPEQVLITTVRREENVIVAHGETILEEGDVVTVLTHQESEDALRHTLEGMH